ncbi:GspH/FimT family pseudopilin [Crenobacter cavernae]|nr:GspH/FimT family pseudopilin [Crenobacter cavernae]
MSRGFTLIELVITLAVVGIVLAIAAPYGAAFINKSKARSLTGELTRSLMSARSQAITYGRTVSVCGRSAPDTLACAANAEGWRNGWLVFWGGPAVAPTAANLIANVNRAQGNVVLNAAAVRVVFYPNGRASPANNGLFTVACRNPGEGAVAKFRTVQLGANGFLNTVIDGDANYAC